MSKPRFKTRRIVNDKAKIQDKEECQSQSQDSGHGGLSITRLRSRIRMGANIKAKIQDKEDCQ